MGTVSGFLVQRQRNKLPFILEFRVNAGTKEEASFGPTQVLKMAVNWAGLVSIGVFYVIVLAIGIWASRKSKQEENKCRGNRSEVAMVGGRNLNVWVSIFTMTGTEG